MKFAVAAILLMGAVAVSAQLKVCEDKQKPGQVQCSSINVESTKNSGKFSDLTLAWKRPAGNACIDTYMVAIVRADGTKIQQVSVTDFSPVHDMARSTFKGLNAGETYKVEVTAKGKGGQGPKAGPCGAFKTAAATVKPTPL